MVEFQFTNDGYCHVFVDGCDNSAKSLQGIGIWFNDDHPENRAESCPYSMGNVPEVTAAKRAIEIARAHGHQKVQIYTDFVYVVKALETKRYVKTECLNMGFNFPGMKKAQELARKGAQI